MYLMLKDEDKFAELCERYLETHKQMLNERLGKEDKRRVRSLQAALRTQIIKYKERE